MKTLIIAIALTLSYSTFSQEDCKCGDASYKVPGEMISKEVQSNGWYTENYAGIIGDNVQFTAKHFSEKDGKMIIDRIYIKTIPIKSIDWRFNDMFASYSKTKEVTGDDGVKRTELTLGVSFSVGGSSPCKWITDNCKVLVEGISPNMKQTESGTSIWIPFDSKDVMVKFTDKVKAKQESMK